MKKYLQQTGGGGGGIDIFQIKGRKGEEKKRKKENGGGGEVREKYSQIDKEALADILVIKKSHQYLPLTQTISLSHTSSRSQNKLQQWPLDAFRGGTHIPNGWKCT